MGAKYYHTIAYNERGDVLEFDKYQDGELPENREGCVYIFSKIEIGKTEHHHVDCTPRFWELFDEENIKERLTYYDSNCLFIYECNDNDQMESIAKGIRNKHNIPFNYRTGI
jgi:hypothetical protein